MKYITIIFCFFSVLLTFSCKRNLPCNGRVGCGEGFSMPKVIIVVMRDTVSMSTACHLIDSLNLNILISQGYTYSTTNKDSFNVLKNEIQSKAYCDSPSKISYTFPNITNSPMEIFCCFANYSLANHQDWISFINIKQLEDMNDSMKIFHIAVDSGKENQWVDIFKNYSIVKTANRLIEAL